MFLNCIESDETVAQSLHDQSQQTTHSVQQASTTINPSLANLPSLLEQNANAQNDAAPNQTYDDELVMKCLADNVALDSKYKIALFDFGGQSVFNVIHPFFLTQYGVYIVTFNMEWLLGNEGKILIDYAFECVSMLVN